jgi:hypothetical protein
MNQVELENIHSVKCIKKAIEFWVDYKLNDHIEHGIELLKNYTLKTYGYQSKQARVDLFEKHNTFEEIVTEVFITVLAVGFVEQEFTSLVGKLAHIIKGMDDYFDRAKTISEVLAVLCETDVYDILSAKYSEENRLSIRSNIKISDALIERINNRHYIPPMLVKPNTINKISDSPYKTIHKPLVLKYYNQHHRPLATDAINILNSIEWSIDKNVFHNIQEQFKEVLNEKKKTRKKRLRQFKLFKAQSNAVINILIANGNKFYIPHFYDKRGREYMGGYHVNLQGSEYRKALMNLTKKETIPLD